MFPVLTNIDLSLESGSGERRSLASNEEQQQMPLNRAGLPRLAPQCGGNPTNGNQMAPSSQHSSLQSLVSLGRSTLNACPTSNQLNRPSPRSLQVSPALAQRSLYAQHILSSPEIIGINTTDSRHHQNARSALKTATSEFSFIRPDSPLTLPHNSRVSTVDNNRPQYHRSQSCLESQKLRQNIANNTQNCVNRSQSATNKQTMERMIQQSIRPSSIYGQPSFTQPSFSDKMYTNSRVNTRIPEYDNIEVDKTSTFGQTRHSNGMIGRMPVRDTRSMPKRGIRQFKSSKSDSIFATSNRLYAMNGTNGTNGEKNINSKKESDSTPSDKLNHRNRIQTKEMFAVR